MEYLTPGSKDQDLVIVDLRDRQELIKSPGYSRHLIIPGVDAVLQELRPVSDVL